MSTYHNQTLHYLGKTKKKDVFVVNIGAMDGVSFDDTRGFIDTYNWHGLFVEPIPYLFNKLLASYPGNDRNLYENSAIGSTNGVVEMITIDEEPIKQGLIHECFAGMSSVYPPLNGLASEGDKETVKKYGKIIKVPSITLKRLFTKHKIKDIDVMSIDTEGYDWKVLQQLKYTKILPTLIRCEYINLNEDEQKEIQEFLTSNGYLYEIIDQNIDAVNKEFWEKMHAVEVVEEVPITPSNITVVTGIWNLKRDKAGKGFQRPFKHYTDKFVELLKADINLFIYIEKDYEELVWQHRKPHNTKVFIKEVDEFRGDGFDGYDLVQKIRKNKKWLEQAEWLANSTQATLELYNPMVMSKMFMLHDASIHNPFGTDYFIWLDGGITNTVHPGYFTHDKIINKLEPYLQKFFFISFPYETTSEIHGFEYEGMKKYAKADKVDYVCRGGLFGGHKVCISKANAMYYNLLMRSLNDGYMGTEESIFTIMSYLDTDMFQRYSINGDGLINTFAEHLKTANIVAPKEKAQHVALYVIGFNSPDQFDVLIQSWLRDGFINNTANYLIDNSTDLSTTPRYKELCERYNFTHIKKDNLGICGGRQFIAEHFANTEHNYYIFLEDDMNLQKPEYGVCRNGFPTFVPDLYNKVLGIIEKEKYDFIKFSFSEFFGDNRTQWAWYNVPQTVRAEYWPDNCTLPQIGLSDKAPLVEYKYIKSYEGLPYAGDGAFYCNWPQIVSREGNKKMFLNTKWAHPFEQTWMSHIFQLTKAGTIKSAVLLASPINHHRFHHYAKELRKES